MIRARDKRVRPLTLLIAMVVFSSGVTLVFASGGLAIRKLEHYECQAVCSDPSESFVCGLYGRNRKTLTVPHMFLYWKKVRPFGFYLKYYGEPHRYSRISVQSVKLTTDDGCELVLNSDSFPLARDLQTVSHPDIVPFSHFSHIFDTVFDIPFENIESIHYIVELQLENERDTRKCLYEGVLDKISIDSVGRYR